MNDPASRINTPSFSEPVRPLWWKLAGIFGLFVVLGSLALVLWLQLDARRVSEQEFAAAAKSNGRFVLQTGLPTSAKLAEDLGKVLGVRVHFNQGDAFMPPLSAGDAPHSAEILRQASDGKCRALAGKLEVVSQALPGSNSNMIFMRDRESATAILLRPQTLAALGVFWLLSLALAMIAGRTLVRPLQSLAQQLPRIDEPGAASLAGVKRQDEIGHLARVFVETRSQLARERALRMASERLAMLGKMAASLAHEVQNPVAAIRLHGQLLQQAMPSQRSLDLIIEETVKIEDLVNQWLFLARPEPPAVVECDVEKLLAECGERLRPKADYAGVTLNVTTVGSVPAVAADRRRMAQVFGNILTNAIQATPSGGRVSVTVHGGEANQVTITFADEGRGFSSTALERWRELFYSEKEGGMGIGLSLAVEVVRAHGGELSAANAEGGGAVLTMILPTASKS